MLNFCVFCGRLTRDPEIRYTKTNTPTASFSLAVERDFAEGEGGRKTDFIDFVAWQKTAEFVGKYFHKGDGMTVVGRMQIRDWTDKDGNKRRSAEIVADRVYFQLGGGGKPAQEPAMPQLMQQAGAFAEIGEQDGELPF